MMGYDKFKHLNRTECCECINKHLLPIRTPNEICRKLNDMLKTSERQDKYMVIVCVLKISLIIYSVIVF